MIVDRLVRRSEWVRQFADQGHLIQAPFALSPPHGSKLRNKTVITPRKGGMVSGELAKPPYERTVVFGNGEEGQEQSALFVRSVRSEVMQLTALPSIPEDSTHVLLVTVVGLTSRFDCLVVYRFLAFCGDHYSAIQDVTWNKTLSDQAFIEVNEFSPEDTGAQIQFTEDDWRIFLEHQVGALAALFALMNCRNVVKEVESPSRAQQRARRKSGKLPLYRYHVLKVKPLAGPQRRRDSLYQGEKQAIHWVRGHFKHYTREKPLFGRNTGLFWWEPHLAGRAPRRVEKSYQLST